MASPSLECGLGAYGLLHYGVLVLGTGPDLASPIPCCLGLVTQLGYAH